MKIGESNYMNLERTFTLGYSFFYSFNGNFYVRRRNRRYCFKRRKYVAGRVTIHKVSKIFFEKAYKHYIRILKS